MFLALAGKTIAGSPGGLQERQTIYGACSRSMGNLPYQDQGSSSSTWLRPAIYIPKFRFLSVQKGSSLGWMGLSEDSAWPFKSGLRRRGSHFVEGMCFEAWLMVWGR